MLGPNGRTIASSRWTRLSLLVGTVVSAVLFMMAVVLDFLGRPTTTGDPSDLGAVLAALADLRPWGWASAGTLVIILTPAVGLVATAWEYRAVADRRTTLTALGVLGILGVSLAIALLRS